MKKGWIVYNAFCYVESTAKCIQRLYDALTKKGFEISIVKHSDIKLCFDNEGDISPLLGLEKPLFCIYWDKDALLAHMLEKWGVRVFNKAKVLEICDNKGKAFFALSNNGIAMPKTIISPLVYPANSEENDIFAQYVADTLGFPLIVKESYGSFGAQVHIAEDFSKLKELRKKLLHNHHLYQQYIKNSKGKDLRVFVIGGEPICAMMRNNDKDFRANIELGGKGTPYTLNKNQANLAEKISNILGADFVGVDFLFDIEGLKLCEVNANAHFLGIEAVTGVNIADTYAQHIFNTVTNGF